MTKDQFENIINTFGEENILGIGFDNSAGITFKEDEFKLSDLYNSTLGCLQFTLYDIKNNPYTVIKMVDDIQSIMVKDSSVNFGDYDRVSIRS